MHFGWHLYIQNMATDYDSDSDYLFEFDQNYYDEISENIRLSLKFTTSMLIGNARVMCEICPTRSLYSNDNSCINKHSCPGTQH